ncbi:hypothetical protein J3A83DRAFT_4361015 [Scleroderma citrinum]
MAFRQRHPNQNKPNSPVELIKPHIRQLWQVHLTKREIVAELQKLIDTSQYGIGELTKFIEIHNDLGLCHTHQQGHIIDSIHSAMAELQSMYLEARIHEMISLIFHEHNMSVSQRVMCQYFATYKPHLIRQHKANHLQWCHFWVASVNDIWTIDQHDKWIHFGLALHTGIWHSNHNPQLILSYYLETGEIQSDLGTENFGIANAQTMLCQMHDPNLEGFVQHRWMHIKKNIKTEIVWSQFQHQFTPGFEALLEKGMDSGWYDPDNTLQLMRLFIPWLQQEMNNYVHHINNTQKHHGKRKILCGDPTTQHS